MQSILPGKPQAKLQAISTAKWKAVRLVIYISGNVIIILSGPNELLQTICVDECDELSAVTLDERSGNVAACSNEEVYIYSPFGGREGSLRWTLSSTISLSKQSAHNPSLSWGPEEELLVGSTSLNLYQFTKRSRIIWHQELPNPARAAIFSPDSNLLASHGFHDENIKLWRRQSFDPEDTRFDFTYLVHPATITLIQWRQTPKHEHHRYEQLVDDVLYSVATDHIIRIWSASDPHALSHMQLWAQIDMQECLQPRHFGVKDHLAERFVFFIQQDDFSKVSTQSFNEQEESTSQQGSHAQEHLAEIASTKPDICVVLDRHGNMSAWGLENVGWKSRKESNVFNVAHVQDFNVRFQPAETHAQGPNVTFVCFLTDGSSPFLSLLTHHFGDRISWRQVQAIKMFDPSPRSDRMGFEVDWTGHKRLIHQLSKDGSGHWLLSRCEEEKVLLWQRKHSPTYSNLEHQSTISPSRNLLDVCLLNGGDFAVTLSTSDLALWDTRRSSAVLLSRDSLAVNDKSASLLSLHFSRGGQPVNFIAVLYQGLTGTLWSCHIPMNHGDLDRPKSLLQTLNSFTLGIGDVFLSLRSMEPVSYSYSLQQRAPCFTAKRCLIGISRSGIVQTWSMIIYEDHKRNNCAPTASVKTNIHNATMVSGSRTSKIAIVDASKSALTIWDAGSSCLEYEHSFGPSEAIQDLDWAYTTTSSTLLAVGSPSKVKVLSQIRYEFFNQAPAWMAIRSINIKDFVSNPISDAVWLSRGNLAMCAGNQIFICNAKASNEDVADELGALCDSVKSNEMMDIVSFSNASVPLYHPQFLMAITFSGRLDLVNKILKSLNEAVKYFAPGDKLDPFLSVPCDQLYHRPELTPKASDHVAADTDTEDTEFSELDSITLRENLSKSSLPDVTPKEQADLLGIVDCLDLNPKSRRAIDESGRRFSYCFNRLRMDRILESQEREIPWREIVWAMHSESQDILVDQASRSYNGRLGWTEATECGMLLWLKDRQAVEAQFEAVARNEYTKTEEKNPIDCSLFYIALGKKNVLLNLWRMATWNREQQGTQKLLKNDFTQARWKTAALKNAYALLGKRRFGYAAAWFLLAGNLKDAVNVCLNQMGDLQLAIAIARVYGGDDCIVLKSLIEDTILPQAAKEGSKWQATWAFTILGQHDMAIKALVEPLEDLIPLSEPASLRARSYLRNEPSLIHLYRHLRKNFLVRMPNAIFPIDSAEEWNFVIQTARTYDRMGCGLIALDLLRNWDFIVKQSSKAKVKETAEESSTDDEETDSQSGKEDKVEAEKGEQSKPKPTMFHEPDASSLLDSFGF